MDTPDQADVPNNITMNEPNPEDLTNEQLRVILKSAEGVASTTYGGYSTFLLEILRTNIQHATVGIIKGSPQEVLDQAIQSEVQILNQWNHDGFGDPLRKAGLGHIREEVGYFPIRAAATEAGVQYRKPPALLPQRQQIEMIQLDGSVAVDENDRLDATTKPFKKRGHGAAVYDVLVNTPSCNIPFPSAGVWAANITAVELIAFFPQWLKSWDVTERLISNGGSTHLIEKIIVHHRDIQPPSQFKNSIFKLMMRPMRARGDLRGQGGHDYRNWSVGRHQPLPNHDPDTINVAGFRTSQTLEPKLLHHIPMRDRKTDAIAFKDLAAHIKQFPTGFDALDLTRCIQYAVANPRENWLFPDHFQALVYHLSGGLNLGSTVTDEHLDGAAFRRWEAMGRADSLEKRRLKVINRNTIGEEASEDENTEEEEVVQEESPKERIRTVDTAEPVSIAGNPLSHPLHHLTQATPSVEDQADNPYPLPPSFGELPDEFTDVFDWDSYMED